MSIHTVLAVEHVGLLPMVYACPLDGLGRWVFMLLIVLAPLVIAVAEMVAFRSQPASQALCGGLQPLYP